MRDENDRWIRIAVKEGVMILLPAGIYHRFALDTNNYLKVIGIPSLLHLTTCLSTIHVHKFRQVIIHI